MAARNCRTQLETGEYHWHAAWLHKVQALLQFRRYVFQLYLGLLSIPHPHCLHRLADPGWPKRVIPIHTQGIGRPIGERVAHHGKELP
eukprot:4015020-Amphidinium_carterae.2